MTKKLPPKPTNAPELLDLLESQTRALGKLFSNAFRPHEAGDLPEGRASLDVASARAAMVGALRPTLEVLAPEPKVLIRIIASGSADALKLLFDLHGPGAYRDYTQGTLHNNQPAVSFSDPIKRSNIDMLRVFLETGFDLAPHAEKMLTQALRRDTPDYLSFVREKAGFRGRILDAVPAGKALAAPRDWVLEELTQELDSILFHEPDHQVHTELTLGTRRMFQNGNLRFFALHLFAGQNLAQRYKNIVALPPAAQRLVDMTASNHGRLALKDMEPSLRDILARPKDGPFYGLTKSDVTSSQPQG